MPLKNYQYNTILREYDRKQLKNRHELELRQKKAYSIIPELQEIDIAIASNSVGYAKESLFGTKTSLSELEKKNHALSLQKEKLLLSYGFSRDYLTLRYDCKDCKDTGYIGQEKCYCFKQAIVDLLYSQSNLKTCLERDNFHTFRYDYYPKEGIEQSTGLTPYENIKNVVATCQHFIKTFHTNYENLLIYGETGVGKTFLTSCIARELLNLSYTVIYLTAFELFDILEKNKFHKEEEYEAVSQFEYILDCDLLILDDLGTELNNTFVSSQLYLCINERDLKQKSTIISTNLSLNELNHTYGERISSRSFGNYTLLKLFGEDIRIKKAFVY